MESALNLDTLMAVFMGLGLSTACGFRIFVPLTVLSLAALFGGLPLPENLLYLNHPLACLALCSATLIEIGAYYIPWVDNALDALATPLAVGAGALVSFGFLPEMPAFLQWSIALIAGGGLAGVTQSATVVTRAASSAGTGGLGNFIVSTLEAFLAVLMSILAILLPLFAFIAMCFVGVWVIRQGLKWRQCRSSKEHAPAG